MNKLYFRALRSSIYGFFAMAALLFVPAGTLDYRQAYVFMAVFVGGSTAITVYLAIKDPKLLERRMKVGPTAEKEPTQKIIMVFALLGFIALLVVPALDRRFMWSSVPPWVTVLGDILVGLGFLSVYFVIRENSYAASTIQVAEGQTVVSTGPYAGRAPPDVCRSASFAHRNPACARLVVRTGRAHFVYACANMAASG
jgi:protein-S-isoprenylcysteine O-methyltransferase Ste14